MKRFLLIIILVAFLIGLTGTVIYGSYRLIYDNYFKTNDRIVSVFNETHLNLVIDDEIIISSNPPVIIDGQLLLPANTIKEHFDPHLNIDESGQWVTITTDTKLIRMKKNTLEVQINKEPLQLDISIIEIDDTIYVPIEFLKDIYYIDITVIESSNVVIIDHTDMVLRIAVPINDAAVVRSGRSIKDPVVAKFDGTEDNGRNEMRVFTEYEKWYKVRTWDGRIGYIEKRYVAVSDAVIITNEKPQIDVWKPAEGKLSLVWEQMRYTRPDLESINIDKGLDIVSPTWLHLKDSAGNVTSYSDKLYVEWAHSKNLEVWSIVTNEFKADRTHEFLKNVEARDNFISKILDYAIEYNLDGINIDFENIYLKDKDNLTQFVREITPILRTQNLVVSIDVGVPGGSDNYSLCYDREELGKTVDYVMLMTYDQHWETSPISGSVAQVSWMERKLKETLREVPADKLVLGIPFYIRIWEEETTGMATSVSSTAWSMDYVKNLIENKGADTYWDEQSGQYYAEYRENDVLHRIWVEDLRSIDLKSSLVHKYNLAGTAGWSRGLETQEVWALFDENLKDVRDYFVWKDEYSKRHDLIGG